REALHAAAIGDARAVEIRHDLDRLPDAHVADLPFLEIRLDPQPVEVVSDLYGSRIAYRGRVQGFSAGTGSAFSMLPSQNAAGNWIKV
ncbi:hypothetical protein QM312_36205, partial [Burkholderia cenocepacia]|nr:hypothetical protein [Burkholderia cenocepacia]